MKVRTLIVGYLFGIVFTWAIYFIMPIIMSDGELISVLINYHLSTIFRNSLIIGLIFGLVFGVIGWLSNRSNRKKELDDAMIEYFRNKAKEDKGE